MEGGEGPAIMKRDAVGRVSYTAQQREALLDEFERSGLKGAQFALAAGVKYQTFAHWVQQRRHARGGYAGKGDGAAALRLVEAVVAGVGDGTAGSVTVTAQILEVHLPGGARMLVATAHQAGLAACLLQALARPC
jgi:hypothetical protein